MRRTSDQQYRFASSNFDLYAELSQNQIGQTYGDNWINYPLGVLDQFIKQGADIDGIECLFSGNVPNGAGLSSSASIEVVTAFAINQVFDIELPLMDLVHLAQNAENDFVGMQCGIMDQFAVAMAKQSHAMLLDCATLEYRQVPLTLDKHAIVLANTNQRRELNESAYNDRVAECTRALALLQPRIGIQALGELTPVQLEEQVSAFADDPIALSRARHVAGENARVRSAVPLLEAGDLDGFGQLMNASHDSLRDLFDVSSEPLNHLVSIARAQAGVSGSRLTGAGFGGCTVSLVTRISIDDFINNVGRHYQEATGLTADFYTIDPGDGVHEVSS